MFNIKPTKAAAKQPKYRASCDSCNEAKVRCSQTRPRCAQCIKKKVHCVFSISQRAGKHRSKTYNALGKETKVNDESLGLPLFSETCGSTLSGAVYSEDPFSSMLKMPGNPTDFQDFWISQQCRSPCFGENGMGMEPVASSYQFLRGREGSSIINSYDQTQPAPQPGNMALESGLDLTSQFSNPLMRTPPPSARLTPNLNDNYFSDALVNTHRSGSEDFQGMNSLSPSCNCSSVIITQLSSLPVLLHTDRNPFDTELLQFQQAIGICTKSLACPCAGKDHTSVLSISMLIVRIIHVIERGLASNGDEEDRGSVAEDLSMDLAGVNLSKMSLCSPKFSLGAYTVDVEDDRTLKQEIWWLQVKKVEALVLGFKDTVILRGQECQDMAQVGAWEKLCVLLERLVHRTKEEWREAWEKS